MKKTIVILGTFLTLFFIACEGPSGYDGYDGYDGIDGEDGLDAEIGQVFEIETDLALNTDANRFELLFEEFPTDVDIFSSDVVLIYRLEEVVATDDGDLDVWRQLPQPFITNEGTFFYNFDFTQGDFSIYAETEFDASLLSTDFTDAQVFRIAVVPAAFISGKLDKSNIASVMSSLGLEEKDIHRILIE